LRNFILQVIREFSASKNKYGEHKSQTQAERQRKAWLAAHAALYTPLVGGRKEAKRGRPNLEVTISGV
jgi:hypothetical protein